MYWAEDYAELAEESVTQYWQMEAYFNPLQQTMTVRNAEPENQIHTEDKVNVAWKGEAMLTLYIFHLYLNAIDFKFSY